MTRKKEQKLQGLVFNLLIEISSGKKRLCPSSIINGSGLSVRCYISTSRLGDGNRMNGNRLS